MLSSQVTSMGILPVLLQLTCRKNRFSWLMCTILFPSWCKNLSALSQKMDTILSKSNGGLYKAKRFCRKSGAFKTNQYNLDAFSFREKSKLPKIKCSAWDHSSAISVDVSFDSDFFESWLDSKKCTIRKTVQGPNVTVSMAHCVLVIICNEKIY